MARNIIILIVVVALAVFGYYYWQRYTQEKQETNGAYTCTGCMSPAEKAKFDKKNSGDTADGQSERKDSSARQEDAAGNPGGQAAVNGTAAPTYPPANAPMANQTAGTNQAPAGTQSYGDGRGATPAGPVPTYDSQAPNNPNSMHFVGSGQYQWYRQGNLTYRVDTVSGGTCIALATMEEWRKQIVYSHGCGRGA